MTTATRVLSIAAGEIGYTRWSDPQKGTKYGRWYAQRTGHSWFGNNGIAYCNMFTTWVLAQAGVPEPPPGHFAYVPYAINAYQKQSRRVWNTRSAQPGDLVCFDWNHDGVADHIGIVERNYGTHLQTIEGNTSSGTSGSQSNGGGVYRRARAWGAVMAILRPAYGEAAGWVEQAGKWWWRNTDGSYPRDTWKLVGGTWYRFDTSGWMQTGWVRDKNTWYYLDSSGAMRTGWLYQAGTWYYLDQRGAMQTGWAGVNDKWYYLDDTGAMRTGWIRDGDTWYYLDPETGAMQTGWIKDQDAWYWTDQRGAMDRAKWKVVNGTAWYLDDTGAWTQGRIDKNTVPAEMWDTITGGNKNE